MQRIVPELVQYWRWQDRLCLLWSFRTKARFSVEVYIDTGEKEKNKQFFDRL